jgi:hypothetical protein
MPELFTEPLTVEDLPGAVVEGLVTPPVLARPVPLTPPVPLAPPDPPAPWQQAVSARRAVEMEAKIANFIVLLFKRCDFQRDRFYKTINPFLPPVSIRVSAPKLIVNSRKVWVWR